MNASRWMNLGIEIGPIESLCGQVSMDWLEGSPGVLGDGAPAGELQVGSKIRSDDDADGFGRAAEFCKKPGRFDEDEHAGMRVGKETQRLELPVAHQIRATYVGD